MTYPEFVTSHLLHDTLSGAEGVEDYHVYRDPTHPLGAIVAVARLGHRVRGHPNIGAMETLHKSTETAPVADGMEAEELTRGYYGWVWMS